MSGALPPEYLALKLNMLKNLTSQQKMNLYYSPFVKILPSTIFLRIHYRVSIGKRLNFTDPQTFNEKMQWLKLYYHDPVFTIMVDKYEVKDYVSRKIGENYVIPSLGVYDSFEDINFDELPNQFVLKCTHDSGGIAICKDKSRFDYSKARERLSRSLSRNYYYLGREWPYKNVKPRILVEEYMENKNRSNLDVYKILTFNGIPRIVQTIQNDKTPLESIDYFDSDWNKLDMRQDYPNSTNPLEKPTCLDEMLQLAAILGKGIPFLRVDLYEIDGKVYFSEFTFYSDCGFAPFTPSDWDNTLGSWIQLPDKKL